MCGIVGLFLKDKTLEPQLGSFFKPMLVAMGERGSDSAGFAVYRDPVPTGHVKITAFHPDPLFEWGELADNMTQQLGTPVDARVLATHVVLIARDSKPTASEWLREQYPNIQITSTGSSIEIFKQVGAPDLVADRFGIDELFGSHAIGHTRMATESAVTTEHSHPFSTGLDLCLVHNGSLSNHNRLRLELRHRGIVFETDNDSEVAAGYLTHKLQSGATLDEALQSGLLDLDGFFTFAVGSREGFAVLLDPIACKPAVLAETDQWVAMASEYRALAHLPGATTARIWEPAPATVYSWSRN